MISSTHLHAMLIHFPIALLMVGFLSELIAFLNKKLFFRQAAFYLLILGTLGAMASYLTGRAAGKGMDDGALGKAMALHEHAATLALWLIIATAVFYLALKIFNNNKPRWRMFGLVLFAAAIGVVAKTGYLGGQLVYKHGAGIELSLPDFSDPENN